MWERGPVSRARKWDFTWLGREQGEGGSGDGALVPGEAKSQGVFVCRITDPGLY